MKKTAKKNTRPATRAERVLRHPVTQAAISLGILLGVNYVGGYVAGRGFARGAALPRKPTLATGGKPELRVVA